jgi:tetratricopeptide (TPR) repeat protein
MKKILLIALLLLSLMVCVTYSGCSGGVHDIKAGIAAGNEGDYDKAIELFTKAIESGKLSQENLSIAYYNRGRARGERGDYDKAIADFDKAIIINPMFAEAYGNRGNVWYLKGDFNKAITDITKSIEINPKYADAYYNRGFVWYSKGTYDKAMADFNTAIEIDPKHAYAYSNRGIAWGRKGDYDKAIADFDTAIEINPMYAEAYSNRGYAWEKKGDYDKAIADYTKAIALDPKNAYAYNSLAWLQATCPEARYRDGTRAVELAEKAVRLENAGSILDTLAAAYAEAGRFQEAIKTQEKAIKLLEKEGETEDLAEFKEHLDSYKAGKPWREK